MATIYILLLIIVACVSYSYGYLTRSAQHGVGIFEYHLLAQDDFYCLQNSMLENNSKSISKEELDRIKKSYASVKTSGPSHQ